MKNDGVGKIRLKKDRKKKWEKIVSELDAKEKEELETLRLPCGVDENELAEDDGERYQTFLPEEDEELDDDDFVAFMAKFEQNNKARLAGMTEWEKKKAAHVAWLNFIGLETVPDSGGIDSSNKRQRTE